MVSNGFPMVFLISYGIRRSSGTLWCSSDARSLALSGVDWRSLALFVAHLRCLTATGAPGALRRSSGALSGAVWRSSEARLALSGARPVLSDARLALSGARLTFRRSLTLAWTSTLSGDFFVLLWRCLALV